MDPMSWAVAYNERLSVIHYFKSNMAAFQQIADAATDPDVKARYVQAVQQMKRDGPIVESQMREYAGRAGVDDADFGHTVDPTQYAGYNKQGKGVRFPYVNLFASA
ncbi:hypothetical protein [Chromobacterium alticapitis]|uniref:Uncharacterized protein n=1 Tax=Chromobacterium alticapitis TaxID=2073169 RepID=A0A2S5DIW3_9NEIS|nr:hypothetical protein [Chromobacterium alticapitis]POZ62928.1 hypothetical protein C2I19_05980 [Chromobacterium alticapitis]